MRILVTGSSGRLGRRVVSVGREMGHDMIPVDVRPPADGGDTDTRIVDLSKVEGLPKLFEGVDAVAHIGNLPGFAEKGKSHGYLNNTAVNYNVFLAADQVGIERVVYASSVQSYGCFAGASGPPWPGPYTPPRYLPLDEDHPLLPADAYPLSKATGEWIGESFSRARPKLTVWALRFTAIRGARRRPPVRPTDWEPTAWGSLFTWIHGDDAARATILAAQKSRPGFTALNVVAPSSSQAWTKEALIKSYGHVPEFRRPLTPDDSLISSDRAAEVLNFRAERTREDLAA